VGDVGRGRDHRSLLAEGVVDVRSCPAERVGAAGHVAVAVVAELRGLGRVNADVIADGAGCEGLVGVEDEAGQRRRRCR
jgi:hypothetical protein